MEVARYFERVLLASGFFCYCVAKQISAISVKVAGKSGLEACVTCFIENIFMLHFSR